MKAQLSLLIIFVALLTAGCDRRPSHHADEVGNGGDPRPKIFERGRAKASRMVETVLALKAADLERLPSGRALAVEIWYRAHRIELARDIEQTPPYLWVPSNANGACGSTHAYARAPVALAYLNCPATFTVGLAAVQLIGESVHHLGITDDDFAALVANGVSDGWDRRYGKSVPATEKRLQFDEGRLYASEILERITAVGLPDYLQGYVSTSDMTWLRSHAKALARIVRASRHRWTEDDLPESGCAIHSCVQLEEESGDTLLFSYPGCGNGFQKKQEIAELILHAAIHRLRRGEEEVAQRISVAVLRLWYAMGHVAQPHWFHVSEEAMPNYRELSPPVWTGAQMVFWSPNGKVTYYDPRRGAWHTDVPKDPIRPWIKNSFGLKESPAAWAAGKLVVYANCYRETRKEGMGQVYDPKSQIWRLIPTENGPSPRHGGQLLSTPSRVVVWGGLACTEDARPAVDGAVYEPDRDRWEVVSPTGRPDFLLDQSAVLAGDRLVVWGGGSYDPATMGLTVYRYGKVYDLEKKTWARMASKNAPVGSFGPLMVWAGKYVFVYGGYDRPLLELTLESRESMSVTRGGLYDLDSNQWVPIPDGPVRANGQSPLWGAWDGRRILVWGAGKAYFDPLARRWSSLDLSPSPYLFQAPLSSPLEAQRLLWTGMEVLVWSQYEGRGFAYFP